MLKKLYVLRALRGEKTVLTTKNTKKNEKNLILLKSGYLNKI